MTTTNTWKPVDKAHEDLKKDLAFLNDESLNTKEQSKRVEEYAKAHGTRAPMMFEITEGYSMALGLVGLSVAQVKFISVIAANFTRNIMDANDRGLSKEEMIEATLKTLTGISETDLEAKID